jgi:hypothetical protein
MVSERGVGYRPEIFGKLAAASPLVLPAKIGGVAMKSSALIHWSFLMVANSTQAAESPNPAGRPSQSFSGAMEVTLTGRSSQKACYTI